MTRNHSTLAIAIFVLAAGCGDSDSLMAEPEPPREFRCADPPAADAEAAAGLYLSAWSESDADERACQLQRSVATDAVLIDANGTLVGLTSIVDHIDTELRIHAENGSTRELQDEVTFRHEEALALWFVADRDAVAVETGEDWIEFGPDGRITRIHTFLGVGTRTGLSDELVAWERAWNVEDGGERAEELARATTEDVRFTDLLTDVAGREGLALEIERQRAALGGELTLDEDVAVFATEDGVATLIRQEAEIAIPEAGVIRVLNYVRLRNGRIERLAGFPTR